ncbi:MAG: hypothetical protein EOM35_02385 [Negativicutes bacterium]|nr:hypothetical protein [Negativicutes bacterium]
MEQKYTAKKFDPKGEGMRWMLAHKSRVAEPPKNINERIVMANRLANTYANENKSDPFAAAVMRSRVMNSLFDEQDTKGKIRISV